MPNLAGVLKDEIRRLARKEARAEMAATRKAAARHRKDIAELRRQIRDQQKEIARLERTQRKEARVARQSGGAGSSAPSDVVSIRFSPKWLATHREKLGLSAADYAALVGCSALTIYNWEKGKTRPRAAQLEALHAVRQLGKREAYARLEEME